MSLISRLNPKDGVQDFWSEFRRPNPYRWRILAASMTLTGGLMYLIIQENVVGPPVPYDVEYITSFEPGRTDEEIMVSNIENQRKKEEMAALLEQNEERKKELYRALARASGMDPDEIEREAAEEEARDEAAAIVRREQALGRSTVNSAE
ncbi:hypothetical protein GCM10023115_55970 [Pontixanthobacter gangjinensis]|uniref:Uncharacterized protein n=1 Tax=Pontixanthobacter gangjinensis TaxID=1028742 RepID=A0A6I4SRZ1_9SPHN|nr:hypothetical protein [Pontixanthobacter gangjinensis]MXO57880.1 hypothetical protein [Pontixanthobacter gangjinensis]